MAVTTSTTQLTRKQAMEWVEDRGIERLPQKDEKLEYVPPLSFNQYDLVRAGTGFALTAIVLS